VVQAIDGKEPAFRCTEIRQRGRPPAIDPPMPALRHQCRMLRAEGCVASSLRAPTLADINRSVGRARTNVCSPGRGMARDTAVSRLRRKKKI